MSTLLVPRFWRSSIAAGHVEIGVGVKVRAEPDRVSGRRTLRQAPWSTTMGGEDGPGAGSSWGVALWVVALVRAGFPAGWAGPVGLPVIPSPRQVAA